MNGNSLKEIEKFITDNFAGNEDYFGVLKKHLNFHQVMLPSLY